MLSLFCAAKEELPVLFKDAHETTKGGLISRAALPAAVWKQRVEELEELAELAECRAAPGGHDREGRECPTHGRSDARRPALHAGYYGLAAAFGWRV